MTNTSKTRVTDSDTEQTPDAAGSQAFDLDHGLGEVERVQLHEKLTSRRVKAGETFIREGETGDCLYIIRDGMAEVRTGDRILVRFDAGHVVGEMALLDCKPRNADVVALTDCLLDCLPVKDFIRLCRKFPALKLVLTRLVAYRLNWSGRDLLARAVGRYQVVKQIGTGAMGWVFQAVRANNPGEPVALKMLPHRLVQLPGFLEQFREEAAILRRLRHDNITALYETIELYGTMFLALEYVPGQNLHEWISRSGLPGADDVRSLTLAVARALQAAHARRIVHRDVKPTNIMVRTDGAVKLTDFGIAAPCDIAGLARGTAFTPAYAAPEMFLAENNNPASDFYSLGVVAYALMTGKNPFESDDLADCARLHRTMTPPPLREKPEDLQHFVAAALTKNPTARLCSVRDSLKRWEHDEISPRISHPPS
jgi:CRP-like cAMP-binding protein